jgi:pilus assembly protein CpaF
MRLSDHLRFAAGTVADDERVRRSNSSASFATRAFKDDGSTTHDPLAALRARTREGLAQRLGSRLYDASLTPQQLEIYVVTELGKVLEQDPIPLSASERQTIIEQLGDEVLGYGALERFLADPTISEVMVNAGKPIYIERGGRLYKTDARFASDAQLRLVIDRIVSAVGRRIDESTPMVDARLADGSRVNAIIPPLALDGPSLTIRKFSWKRLSMDDLIEYETLSAEAAEFLSACVRGRLNILVSGGTGTGKTTLLNVLSSLIENDERIITIEDAAELQLDQEHLIRLESRPPNLEGRGEIAIRDLLRNALRMRPDRIIVGEVRGAEAIDMLQAMNTGHDGSLSTVHANSPRDALSRIETMSLMAGIELPLQAIRDQVAGALDLIVHLSRMRDGSRRITQVTEISGSAADTTDLFAFDYSAGFTDDGRHRGSLVSTGVRPSFLERLEAGR